MSFNVLEVGVYITRSDTVNLEQAAQLYELYGFYTVHEENACSCHEHRTCPSEHPFPILDNNTNAIQMFEDLKNVIFSTLYSAWPSSSLANG